MCACREKSGRLLRTVRSVKPSIAEADGPHTEPIKNLLHMAEQDQGKGNTTGGSPNEKGQQAGTDRTSAATAEQGRKDQQRGGELREDPKAGEPRSNTGGTQGNDQARTDKTRSGTTGGQLGDTDAAEGDEDIDPSRTTAHGNDRQGAAKGHDLGGASGTTKGNERDRS